MKPISELDLTVAIEHGIRLDVDRYGCESESVREKVVRHNQLLDSLDELKEWAAPRRRELESELPQPWPSEPQ